MQRENIMVVTPKGWGTFLKSSGSEIGRTKDNSPNMENHTDESSLKAPSAGSEFMGQVYHPFYSPESPKQEIFSSTFSILSHQVIVRTALNLAFPLIICSKAFGASAKGNFSIMHFTPWICANLIASSLSRACPEGQP